jgi:hypothetical protein
MNETSFAAAATTTTLELSALKALQDILHNRIKQKKGQMHDESHDIMYNQNLWKEIEILHWVLIYANVFFIILIENEYQSLSLL